MDQDDPEKRIAELERQLAQARANRDNTRAAPAPTVPTGGFLSADHVRNMAFSKPPIEKRGYNEDEVDAFLDCIEEQLKSQPGARR